MRRFYPKVVMCVVVVFLLASCDYRVVRDTSVLVQTLPADPSTLNPVLVSETAGAEVAYYLFDTLIEYDNVTLELKPKLAERWEVSPDHLTYTIWLKKNVKWHDGFPLTADDVVFTFEAIRNPKVDAPAKRNYFRDVEGVEKVDDYTVRVKYARPYFNAITIIGLTRIIPKHVYGDIENFNDNPVNRKPVGSGPYRFSKWISNRRIVLERFTEYYRDLPAITGLVFRVIPNRVTAFQLLKKGAIDFSEMGSVQWTFQTDSSAFKEKFTKHRFYPSNCSFIAWNSRTPFFSDVRVRKAMTMLVNRKQILEKVLFNQGEIVASPFYRFGDVYDNSITPYPYDPDVARNLLDEAGWIDKNDDGIREKDGKPFKFTFLIRAGERFGRSMAIFLQHELAKVGIEMEIMQLEWATMIGRVMKREFDAVVMAWSMPLVQDPYQVWHSSQAEAGSNFIAFKNKRVDAILEQARLEFDRSRRNELYKEFQQILHDEQPYTFLFTSPSLSAVARRFEDVVEYKFGLEPLEWKIGPWPVLKEW